MTVNNKTQLVKLDSKGQRIPTGAADLTVKDTWVYQIVLSNTTGTAATVTIKDKQATARYLENARSIPANSSLVLTYPEGVLLSGGMNWVASANAIDAFVLAFRLP